METLTIHNIFGHGYNREDLSRFQELGFILRPQGSSFAGAQELRYIDFTAGPCLKLIEVTDPEEYLSFVPPGMIPYEPGLNLALAENSPRPLSDYQERFQDWQPYLLHENYEGGILILDGIPLYSREAAPLPVRSIGPQAPEKAFSLTAVLLQAESLSTLQKADPDLEELDLGGRQALRIPTPSRSWDLVVHVR
ncbi:MAG: hypothetical protein U5K99_03850 [Anaerolineales bacterium]|nr:hypothetical protein [Anaerolineales bacterium]